MVAALVSTGRTISHQLVSTNGCRNHSFPLVEDHFPIVGNFQSDGVFVGQRALTFESSLMSTVSLICSGLIQCIDNHIDMGMYQETMLQKEGTHYYTHSIIDVPLLTTCIGILLGSHRLNFKDLSQKQKRDQ